MFQLQTVDGTVLKETDRLAAAMEGAENALKDDPELGEVEVWANHAYLTERPKYIGKATHVPDKDWQSVVAWVWEGQAITPPGPIPDHMTDEEIEDVYRDDPGKLQGMRQMRESGWS